MKSYLLIQLVFNGRAVWQVKQDVPDTHCRRMTQEELAAFGLHAQQSLKRLIEENPVKEPVAAASEAPRKKR